MPCDKTTYHTWAHAREAVAAIGQETGQSMHVYRCQDCNGIHIATAGKRRGIKRKPVRVLVTKYKYLGENKESRERKRNPKSQQSLPLATYKLLSPEMATFLKQLIEHRNKIKNSYE